MVVCAGDIVGYCANPNECAKIVKNMAGTAVLGNHDVSALTGDTTWMNPYAARASRWTSGALDEDSRAYLGSLKTEARLRLDGRRLAIYHGAVGSVTEYVYEEQAGEDMLERANADVLVLGHTHVPYAKKLRTGLVVNPGSVGQPRDGDPRASYAVLDLTAGTADIKRLDYDVEGAYDAIIAAGLPEMLAERLFMGR
jgi:putative phosphoesterase